LNLEPGKELVGIDDLLKSGDGPYSVVRIATMQRGYEWDERNWSAYFRDVETENFKAYPEPYPHKKGPFIGVAIIIEHQSKGRDPATGENLPPECEIIDGQQRVTTTFILAAIIRDYLDNRLSQVDTTRKTLDAEEDDVEYQATYTLKQEAQHQLTYLADFLTSTDAQGKRKPRLKTWEYLDPFVAKAIYKHGANYDAGKMINTGRNPLSKRFVQAVNGLRGHLVAGLTRVRESAESATGVGDKTDWRILRAEIEYLIGISKVLLNRMYSIKLTTTSSKDAGEVFLSLNSKGKELGPKDVVKAALIDVYSASTSATNEFAAKWSELGTRVGEIDPFLRLAWMTHKKQKATEKAVALEVLGELEPLASRKVVAESLSGIFFDCGKHVAVMTHPEGVEAQEVTTDVWAITQLYALQTSGSAYRYFLLPYLRRRAKSSKIESPEEVIQLLYTMSYSWKSVFDLPQALEDFYFKLGKSLEDSKEWNGAVANLKKQVGEAVSRSKFETLSSSSTLLVLHALEEAARRSTSTTSIKWKQHDDQVEHTAPQKATAVWELETGMKGEDYKALIKKLGNLTLLNRSQNAGIKQKPWTELTDPKDRKKSKKAAYAQSEFKITMDLAKLPDWSPALIDRRGTWIQEMVVAVYHPETGALKKFEQFSAWSASHR
jgi:hypothetical protein